MREVQYLAFLDELEKISSFSQQQIRAQGAQMIQQGQLMVQNPIGAMSQIKQQASLLANNPATKPHQATQMASLLQSTKSSMNKLAEVQIHAFIDELETVYGYDFDEQTKEAMFGAAAKLIGKGMGAAKGVVANPMLAANNAGMKLMTSPGMQMMVHNPALATAAMSQQLAGGVGQALLGKGVGGAMQAGSKLMPGTLGANLNTMGNVIGAVA